MSLKKYEIITVGNNKRVRALRSWQVGDRYVNIGDVGGIVYDEKTLSQDGACWLFRGNFGFPGARISGDSIVDLGETTLSVKGSPAVDILGSSVVVGIKLLFEADQTSADAVVLTADYFEQGRFRTLLPGDPLTGSSSTTYIRLKNPIFAGGRPVTLKCSVPGYSVTAVALDRDGFIITNAPTTATGVGVTITVPAGQYFSLMMTKDPVSVIVPADAATAAITFTGTYETKLSIIDSRVEINPATNPGTIYIKPGGTYTIAPGAKYPEAIIRNSKVSMNGPLNSNRTYRILGQIIGSTAVLDATARDVTVAGQYSNIKNLTASGALSTNAHNIIQATDCDNFAVSPTVFPGLAAAQTANAPFIFQGCNVPNGMFYHHAQITNTYKNIDFALAQADLGGVTANVNIVLVSSDVEGMYRIYHKVTNSWGPLVESLASVISVKFLGDNPSNGYGTTIYKDAYFNGEFDFAGTNVFGNKVRSHPMAQVLNVQPRAVQGAFNTVAVGETITGVNTIASRVRSNTFFRLNRAEGLKVSGIPNGIQCAAVTTDINNKIITLSPGWTSGELTVANNNDRCYLLFRKPNNSPITPEELTGVTVTVYNGCKIVNTGVTVINLKGNIRVEDNATLVNASITGTGYFGGNSIASGLVIVGSAFMKDNATFVKNAGAGLIRNLKMTDNGRVTVGDITGLGVLHVTENAVLTPSLINLTECDLFMSENASVTAGVSIGGMLTMKDNAKVDTGTLTAYGDITLCGSYNQTTSKSWTGKRVIYSETEPEYDNNVKTQYDF